MSRSPSRILFASAHCLTDFSSGSAIATLDALQLLTRVNFQCRTFCASKLDAGNMREEESASRSPARRDADDSVIGEKARQQRVAVSSDGSVDLTHHTVGELPIQIFETESSRIDQWSPGEAETMLAAIERVVDDFRPDVLLTYGGDPVTKQMRCRVARGEWRARRRIPVVFWLHNFAYDDARVFENVDYVVVPSEFSRQWYQQRLGLECQVLPYVIDSGRVIARGQKSEARGQAEEVSGKRSSARRDTDVSVSSGTDAQRSTLNDRRFLTFVNPQPTKGLFVFARIAEQLQRRRPEIPILVVESRGNADWLEQVPIDLSWCQNLHAMANTHDPRDFYRVTKLMLVPSLWNESFGLVAAEAMVNGIPVLASDRGALPEVIGGR